MKSAHLSEVTGLELDRIEAFIRKEDSPYVIAHSQLQQRLSIDAGLFFKVEDERGDLVGVASVVSTGHNEDYEMANSLIIEEWRGFGLQFELITVRAAALVEQLYTSQRVVTAVDPKNSGPSLKNVQKAGFCLDPDLHWSCGTCPNLGSTSPRKCCCDAYFLPLDRQRELCRRFLERVDQGGGTLRSRGGEERRLEVNNCRAASEANCQILRSFISGTG